VKQPGAKHYLKRALLITFTFAVLYLASAGPIIWIGRAFHLENSRWFIAPLEQFYAPIQNLAQSDTPLGRLFDWYVQFCDSKGKKAGHQMK